MKLQPTRLLNSKILVLPKAKEEIKVGEIILTGQEGNLLEAEVLLVADDIDRAVLKKGETIIFHEGLGIKQYYDGKECTYLSITDILAIV
jgi:co-chaperonin GroES (HSP10)